MFPVSLGLASLKVVGTPMRLWPYSVTHALGIGGLMLAAVFIGAIALDLASRADNSRYARRTGEFVTGEIIGRSVDPNSREGVIGVGQVIEGSCFVHVRFQTRSGFSYNGRTRVSREIWEEAEYARPSRPLLASVCVPASQPESWVLHRDAMMREGTYDTHRRYATATSIALLALAALGPVGSPAINAINRALTRNIPYAYRSTA
jgi:hypothetical protein